jgi:hypothetical protein
LIFYYFWGKINNVRKKAAMAKKIKLSKSFRKYLRNKKAEIRRSIIDPILAEEKIKELEALKLQLLKQKEQISQSKEK